MARTDLVMDIALPVVVVVVLVLALIVWVITRRDKAELPPEAEVSQPEPAALPDESLQQTVATETQATPKPAQPAGAASEPTATAAETPPAAAPEAEPEPIVDVEVDEEARAKRVNAVRKGLANTRGGFIARLAKLFGGREGALDADLLEEIEEVLITADLGVKTADRILEKLREQMQAGELKDEDAVWNSLRAMASEILAIDAGPLKLGQKPALMLVVGVNGVGKTTTIGKLAASYADQGKKVLLAAGDTYRAAAVLQLEVWGNRVGCPVVKGQEGSDPGSVIFEAIKKAQAEGYDMVIADTAGRLHTKAPLMDELKKVDRTIQKALGDRPADEILLVLDSTTGQNAVQQMHMFRQALDVSGVALTKLDGTAKGGVILGIVDEHKLPVRFIGLGERVEDLREFDVEVFVEALFAKPGDETLAA